MKSICLFLFPASLLVAATVIAVALWVHGSVQVVHVNSEILGPAGGMSAAEVQELVD
ncbi:MAG TPA: hypothetical protein VI282_20960 [Verrucomicrobiae bacterium]